MMKSEKFLGKIYITLMCVIGITGLAYKRSWLEIGTGIGVWLIFYVIMKVLYKLHDKKKLSFDVVFTLYMSGWVICYAISMYILSKWR